MRKNPQYALADVEAVRDLVRSAPWCTFVSATGSGAVASHYPVILDEDDEGIVLLSHMGRPDETAHELGAHEMLAIVQGPHGYISPSWYGVDRAVPTWNFVTVHAYGVPEILSDEENLEVLARMVARFEGVLPDPFLLDATPANDGYARRIVRGTVGFRLRVTRLEGKQKLSQDKPRDLVERVITQLHRDGPYRNPALARRMEQMLSGLEDA